MLKKLKGICLIAFAICGISYAGYTLIDPPINASAAQCCSSGIQCGANQVCCRPDSCTLPCDPNSSRPGYCMTSCPPPC